jgi:hypothetical protein
MTEKLLAETLRRSIRYLEAARSRRVSPAQADVERLAYSPLFRRGAKC